MTNTIPEPEGVKPGENIPRKFYGNVLSRTVNNADGTVLLNDDSLTLSCPQVHGTRVLGERPTYFSKVLLEAETSLQGGDAHTSGPFCRAISLV